MNYLLDDLMEFEKVAGVIGDYVKKRQIEDYRKAGVNPYSYEPEYLRRYREKNRKYNGDGDEYEHNKKMYAKFLAEEDAEWAWRNERNAKEKPYIDALYAAKEKHKALGLLAPAGVATLLGAGHLNEKGANKKLVNALSLTSGGLIIGGLAAARHKNKEINRAESKLRAYREQREEQEKTAAREDFVPAKKYGWTQKMPRSYSQWEKFRPKTKEEWDAWEDWQNSVDHGDGDDWDKERWKEQKHFAETGETAEAWIARSAQERQVEAERRMAKQQRAAVTRKKWMKPIAGAALGAASLGLMSNRKRH